jgi:hypothetical protein
MVVPRCCFGRALGLAIGLLSAACGSSTTRASASIELSSVPLAAEGGSQRLTTIDGRVSGAPPGARVVVFARSGVWWVQPLSNEPFTTIQPDATWKTATHFGTEYAALLVDAGYVPPPKTDTLPAQGGPVLAVVTAKGRGDGRPPTSKTLQFSGYEWQIRELPSDRGGANLYDPANAWTDASGFLHLRIAQRDGLWTCAEVILTRSLGYGTYAFAVRDTSQLEPPAAFSMITWDNLGAEQNHREIDIEISRWGDPASKNAQYVVQPFYVAANVLRFNTPAGRTTHTFRWAPNLVSFKSLQGAGAGAREVAEHEFTSGVPTPGGESVRLNLYLFGYPPTPLQKEAEVVIEKFEFLP